MRKILKLPWLWRDFGWQLRTSRRRVCLDQNWMFVDRGEEGGGGPKFRFFCWRRHKWMASHQIIFCYWRFLVVVVVVLFCFSLLLYSLHLHTLFHCCMLSKRDNHYFEKKARENKFENKSENALYTGQFSFDRRSTN